VPSDGSSPLDLIDLKLLPAWVKEPEPAPRYSDYDSEEEGERTQARSSIHRPVRHGRRHLDRSRARPKRHDRDRPDRRSQDRQQRTKTESGKRDLRPKPEVADPVPLAGIDVRFLPQTAAFENVAAQIKAGTAAYSVYALARLFLQKPERYLVRIASKGDNTLFRLGESSVIATDRATLETIAFPALKGEYYRSEVTLNEPVKGNFTSVARERISGILLGPTNHHSYQPQLRRLYEQRFSRRLDFAEFQRQIEIVNDPLLVEKWKEDARKVTTFTTLKEESVRAFSTEAEAERHFREKYLPSLITEVREVVIDGLSSRSLRDRRIARRIESAWAAEMRSPSNMMQELAGKFRSAGLQIFRHRKGMLFVSPIRPRPIEETAVSDSVREILEAVKASARIHRKDLAERLIPSDMKGDAGEKMKLALAAELRWLIREGHIVEFNDGTLDLPRVKAPAPAATAENTTGSSAVSPTGAEKSDSDSAGVPPQDASVRSVQDEEIGTRGIGLAAMHPSISSRQSRARRTG
jgi:hypothetical protein